MALTRATLVNKSQPPKIPVDAEIINKRTEIIVEEIENGFLLTKSYELEYEVDGNRDWRNYSKKYFSEINPFDVDLEEKFLADKF